MNEIYIFFRSFMFRSSFVRPSCEEFTCSVQISFIDSMGDRTGMGQYRTVLCEVRKYRTTYNRFVRKFVEPSHLTLAPSNSNPSTVK